MLPETVLDVSLYVSVEIMAVVQSCELILLADRFELGVGFLKCLVFVAQCLSLLFDLYGVLAKGARTTFEI